MTTVRGVAEWDDGSWRAEAACAGMGPELFFPLGELTEEAARQVVSARAVRARCPVRTACAEFALATNQEDGIWGGLTPRERRVLRRRRAGCGEPFLTARLDPRVPQEVRIAAASEGSTKSQSDSGMG